MKRLLVSCLLFLVGACWCVAQTAIGSWTDHFSYRSVGHVALTPDRVYAAASKGLFYYDIEADAVYRLNKTNGLNDVGVASIAYDPATRYLVVAYDNSNIDLIKDDRVYNLSDIKRSSISGSKVINSIRFHNRCAYLSCGFGIVVVDLDRQEIKESYYIGENGSYLPVYDVAFTSSQIVAAARDGLHYASKDDPLLNIITHWTIDTLSLLAGQSLTALDVNADLLMVLSADGSLYRQLSDGSFVPWLSGDIRSFHVGDNSIVMCDAQGVSIYDLSYGLRHRVESFDGMSMTPNDALLSAEGKLWVGHNWFGLVGLNQPYGDNCQMLLPDGPNDDNVYRLVTFDKCVYLCPGGHSSTYAGMYHPAYLSCFKDNKWSVLSFANGLAGTLRDIVDVSVNPRKSSQLMAASWGVGVAAIENNEVSTVYNDSNSNGAIVRYLKNGNNAVFTGGVAYDTKGNCWMTNSLQDKGLAVRHEDGSWESFDISKMFQSGISNDIDHIVWDSVNDRVWMYGRPNRIFVVDGQGRMAYVNPNNGSKMETSSVNCLVQDHEGDMWMGTNKGIKRIYDGYKAFNNGGAGELSPVSCANIIIEEDGFSEYLMAYEGVTCMAVDGANRKWVGTSSGGLYLLSATGADQLEHFTTNNSPLLSDKIITLAIHPWSGEVFIGTDQGLQSYRSNATFADNLPQDDIHAFPNPVKPDYDGPIAIKGFTRNALVHITDAAGHIVYSTQANGGQAVWYGRTLSGEKVGSGVYFVFASDANGKNRCVTKVLVVR